MALDQTTAGGIAFEESSVGNETAQESYGPDSWTAVRVFRTRWADRVKFVGEFLGGVSGEAQGLIYTPPLTYSDIPTLVARRATAEGEGNAHKTATGTVVYPLAKIAITYEVQSGEGGTVDPVVGHLTESLSFSAEVVTFDAGTFQFTGGDTIFDDAGVSVGATVGATTPLPDAQPGKVMPTSEYTLQIERHPSPPWSDISDLLGTVNNATFNPLGAAGLSFTSSRLLFGGIDSQRQISWNPVSGTEIEAWQITYKFLFRRIPWNFFFLNSAKVDTNPDGKDGWAEAKDRSSNTPFATGDFNKLL